MFLSKFVNLLLNGENDYQVNKLYTKLWKLCMNNVTCEESITFIQTNKNWKWLTKLWKDKGFNWFSFCEKKTPLDNSCVKWTIITPHLYKTTFINIDIGIIIYLYNYKDSGWRLPTRVGNLGNYWKWKLITSSSQRYITTVLSKSNH